VPTLRVFKANVSIALWSAYLFSETPIQRETQRGLLQVLVGRPIRQSWQIWAIAILLISAAVIQEFLEQGKDTDDDNAYR
jgi:hypothetical protein